MFSQYPDLMTVEQARKALNIGRNSMYKLIQSGAIRHIAIANKIRIPKAYIIDYVSTLCYDGDEKNSLPSERSNYDGKLTN